VNTDVADNEKRKRSHGEAIRRKREQVNCGGCGKSRGGKRANICGKDQSNLGKEVGKTFVLLENEGKKKCSKGRERALTGSLTKARRKKAENNGRGEPPRGTRCVN